MAKYEIKINEEMVNYMERLSFEVEGSKRIIKEIIMDNVSNPSVLEGETFKKFNQRFEEKHAAFEIAKSELEKNYIPEVLNGVAFNWNLDFSTGIMTLDIIDPHFDVRKLEA